MKKYSRYIIKRWMSFLLSAALLVGLVPVNISATETENFILVAEAGGKLVIAPEYVPYQQGQTIGEALAASGHIFAGMEDGWITEIDGVVGNYSRSNEKGEYDLNIPASEVGFYRFCESEESQISDGLQHLMTVMADYQTKDTDVQTAAKKAYDMAYAQFVGLDGESAIVLANALQDAISSYDNSQNGQKNKVTFSDGSTVYKDTSITVKNTYGKEWIDDGDGVMELPSGKYSFCICKDGLWVEGTITVSESMTVCAALPQGMWLNLERFRLSGSYGAQEEEENRFSDDEYTLDNWNGRNLTVPVSDTFTGKIYTYAEYQMLSEVPKLTAIYSSAKTGEEIQQELPFESLTSGVANVLKKGAEGNTVIYRISSQGADGYTYAQDYTVSYTRIPSLTGISVKDQNGIDQAATIAFDSNNTEYTYKVLDTVTSVTLHVEPLDENYEIIINGQKGKEDVTVPLSKDGETKIEVTVRIGEYSNTYTLKILPGEGKALSFLTDRADVTLEVVNQNGQVMPYAKFKEGASGNRYQYALIPGETYSYVATVDTYYHIADEFTMEDAADSTIRVDVPVEDWLSDLAFGLKSGGKYKNTLALDRAFTASHHKYHVEFIDTEHNAYVWVDSDEEVNIQAIYEQKARSAIYHGKVQKKTLTSGSTTGTQLNRFLMDENPVENTVTIRLTKEISGTTYYQDYDIDFTRMLTLQDLSAKCEGVTVPLVWEDETTGFDSEVKEYSVTVSMAAKLLELEFLCYTGNPCYGEDEIGYKVEVDGKDMTQEGVAEITLNGTIETQDVIVAVKNDKAPGGTTEYVLHILKSPPVETTFEIMPQQATLAVYETISQERLWPDEKGVYQLCEGYSYNYTLTTYGYVSKYGILDVTRDDEKALVVLDGKDVYKVTETIDSPGALTICWTLEEAQSNPSIQRDMESEWNNFRGNDANNGVTDAPIPTSAENGTLYWANKIGSGYSADAVGSPILVDGDLVTYAGSKIYRVDTVSGEIKEIGYMDHKSAHATTPPSYAQGMVFVALTDGTVQAFNAKTLESLWIYKDPLGGQPICPLTIRNGYLYTGFWNSETGDANFVCLSITDEDTTKADESKCVSWYHTAVGGYYWAGAYVSDEFVIVGTDDGTSGRKSQTSKLLLFHPISGELLDSWEGLHGDIRSTVVYDQVTNAYYFTSKGGSFYSVQVEKSENGWKFTNPWSLLLSNGTDGTQMSTCSPSVYNGRAYVGVSGVGQFSAYSGHNISVIDLYKKSIAYTVQTQGYPQTSGLLTTAYEDASGYVYIYFFDNMTPGKIRVLRDKAGQTSADYMTTEGEFSTAYALFTPTGDQAQYAICSPIVDEYGTIYFKNDSAHMMAFGSTIKKIEVTTPPEKTVYKEGEPFNPSGMTVTATYANGKTRDVTAYVTYDVEKVTAEKTTVTITFPYVMYHNEENGTSMISGVPAITPTTTLNLTINENTSSMDGTLGDVNGDDVIDTLDASLIISYYYNRATLTQEQMAVADVNKDNEIDTIDASLIVSYYYGKIEGFQ